MMSNRSSSSSSNDSPNKPKSSPVPQSMQSESVSTPSPTKRRPPPVQVVEEHSAVVQKHVNDGADEEDEDVRRLAAALAPQVQELDQLLSSPPPLDSARGSRLSLDGAAFEQDDEDSMKSEEKRLEASEQLLRQELEFAQDWSHLMASPLRDDHIAQELAVNYGIQEQDTTQKDEQEEDTLTEPEEETTAPLPSSPQSYTIANHADALGLYLDSGWYVLPINKLSTDVMEYVVPLSSDQLRRFYIGLVGEKGEATPAADNDEPSTNEEDVEKDSMAASRPTATATSLTSPRTPRSVVNTTTRTTTTSSVSKRTPSSSIGHGGGGVVESSSLLPVRTVVMWIRPDVLCGAVMDAVYHSLDDDGNNLGAEITKRQGGHLRAVVKPCVQSNTQTGHAIHCPGYLVDVQLCTYKGNNAKNKQGQRSLILRVYHHYHELWDEDENGSDEEESVSCDTIVDEESNLLLKEAAALVQRMETGGGASSSMTKLTAFSSKFSSSRVYSTEQEIQQVISKQLLMGYRPCPSVLDGRLTLPALSEQDVPVIFASWRWIDACWNELENRDLCYSTLHTCRFGAFPALPTLDVHYCSQLRRLSREGMIVSLLKSASDLEEYAREAEYACANLIQMLRPTFDAYDIEPPALPQPLPLTAYPLDFTPPQSTCPPWGMKVMEALTKVSAMTAEENAEEEPSKSPYELADESIQMVLKAFQQQDDEEQGARLGRKNVQVMDRLAKMQAHKRLSIAIIRDSYGRNMQVVQAADEFHSRAQQASCSADEKSPEDQVPLYKCSVLVRSSTGTLYVTATQLLFVTQFIPIVGGQTCTLFDLAALSFTVREGSSSLISSPLPSSISVTMEGEEVYSFRPSHSAHRLVAFLKVVQAIGSNQSDDGLTFSDRGGLLYMYGDGDSPVH